MIKVRCRWLLDNKFVACSAVSYKMHLSLVRGFWLDIRVGPFITFGVDCDRPNAHAEDLFTIINKGTGKGA